MTLTVPAALSALPVRRGRGATSRCRRTAPVRASLADFGDLADPSTRPSKVEEARRRIQAAKAARAPSPPPKSLRGTVQIPAAAAKAAQSEAEGDRQAPAIALLLLAYAVAGAALDTKLQQSFLADVASGDSEVDLLTSLDADSATAFDADMALQAPPLAAAPGGGAPRGGVVSGAQALSPSSTADASAVACDPLDAEDEAFEDKPDTLPLFLGAFAAPLVVLAARGELSVEKIKSLDVDKALTSLKSMSLSDFSLPKKAAAAKAPAAAGKRAAPRAPPRPSAEGAAARSAAAQARLQAQRAETAAAVRAKLAGSGARKQSTSQSGDEAWRVWWNSFWRN
jgi:hypothetical protein